MTSWRRLRLAMLALALVVGGLLLARSEWLHNLMRGPVPANEWVEVEPRSEAEKADRDALDRQVVSRRIITQDLIDGRTTLAQAVEQFLMMNRRDPNVAPKIRMFYPSDSDEESTALQVIFSVRLRLGNPKNEQERSDREKILCRIEAEFLEMKRELYDAR